MIIPIQVGEMTIEVIQKDIKNLHLSVYPPNGIVRLATPLNMNLDVVRLFVISKLDWIKRQQKKLSEQERESPRVYLDCESHYLWGKRYLLKIIESKQQQGVQLKYKQLYLYVFPGASKQKKQRIIEAWYRQQVKESVTSLIVKWQPLLKVSVQQVFVQKMKTKWGSCNTSTASLRFNTELAKKPKTHLEYIVVHEMAHLLEPTHNHCFVNLMDRLIPHWRFYREELNHLPLGHEQWKYDNCDSSATSISL
jgi:predicted metal-dependent hydrolase